MEASAFANHSYVVTSKTKSINVVPDGDTFFNRECSPMLAVSSFGRHLIIGGRVGFLAFVEDAKRQLNLNWFVFFRGVKVAEFDMSFDR